MIVWGSGGDSKDLGFVESKHCDICEKERPFKLLLQYKYRHLYYLFKWVSEKRYLLLCEICQRGQQLDTKEVESKQATNPIPFGTRYGWTFLLAFIVIVIGFVSFTSHDQEVKDTAYIASPQANDLYLVDLAKILKNPQERHMYGVMKVKNIAGDRVGFLVSNVSYSKLKGARRDIDSGKAAASDYYSAEVLEIPIGELQKMRHDGTISSVRR